MIKVINVFKSFGRGKVKAIDGTTINFDKRGLVALLGPSGCGKTTLLNTIGGLDKVNKGKIYIDGEEISSNNISKVDKIRNNKISYIFQDYKLVNNLSVYQNVEIVLKMIGLKDKKEIKERVLFALEKVDMVRYKKRPCSMLSGGERQRVAIARAIVKDPDIILADEPTGNLDSKNSLEIMKIISSIAKDKLVILVTHEESLAKFYATRIVEILDGKITNDYENNDINELEYIIENKIYLKDFKHKENISKKNYEFNIYQDDLTNINLDIVLKNGNIYIKSDSKVEVIDESTNIELIDDHFKKIHKEEIDKYNFNIDSVIKTKEKKYSSIYKFLSFFTKGFIKIFNYTILKKILLVGFFGSAMFSLFAFGSIFKYFDIDANSFISVHKNYLGANLGNISSDRLNELRSIDGVDYILPNTSKSSLVFRTDDFIQLQEELYISGSLVSAEYLSESDIIYGKYPSNKFELVIDKSLIDELINGYDAKNLGIYNYESILGLNTREKFDEKITIVGVSDTDNPSIYAYEETLTNIMYYFTDNYYEFYNYEFFNANIDLSKGRLPSRLYEVVVSEGTYYEKDSIKLDGIEYKVVGEHKGDENYKYISQATVDATLFKKATNISFMGSDNLSNILADNSIEAYSIYDQDKNSYTERYQNEMLVIIIIGIVILSISLIEIFFMIRTSFLSRVKEVGIYRAIGVKRSDIYKMFVGEILAITTLVSIPGVLLMYYILASISYLSVIVTVNIPILIFTITFLYLFNTIIGLTPVYMTTRKRPAYILSRNDVE